MENNIYSTNSVYRNRVQYKDEWHVPGLNYIYIILHTNSKICQVQRNYFNNYFSKFLIFAFELW